MKTEMKVISRKQGVLAENLKDPKKITQLTREFLLF